MSGAAVVRVPERWWPAAVRRGGAGVAFFFRPTAGERKIYKRRGWVRPSEWVERHLVLTTETLPGPWRNRNMPHVAGMLDASFFPSVEEVIVCAPPQTAKSEFANACICFAADVVPGSVLYIYPIEDQARENSKFRIQPLFKASARLRRYLTGAAEDLAYTLINLVHLQIYIGWAGSVSRLANKPLPYVVFDEVDKYPAAASKKEADVFSLGGWRSATFRGRRKSWKMSSPTVEEGQIWTALTKEAQVVFYFHLRCPFCGEFQRMDFARVRWPLNERDGNRVEEKDLAWYECLACGKNWKDPERDLAAVAGEWRTEAGEPIAAYLERHRPRKIGFHYPRWQVPGNPTSASAAEFLRGQTDIDKLKNFKNGHAAEPWVLVVMRAEEEHVLKARCALPAQVVPEEAVALTCGIDVQKYSFWFVVRAWAKDYRSWLVHYGQLAAWEDVEELLFSRVYPAAKGGRTLGVWRAAIDTGGGKKYADMSMTEETYWWVRKNGIGRGCRVWATMGSSHPLAGKLSVGKPLDKTPSGKPLPGGLTLVKLDTGKIKDMVMYRLAQAAEHGPYASYLHADTGADYARQVTAEEKQRDQRGAEVWVQTRADNHLLDCECLAQIVADPEWPGGGLNLLRVEGGGGPPGGEQKPAGNWVTGGRSFSLRR